MQRPPPPPPRHPPPGGPSSGCGSGSCLLVTSICTWNSSALGWSWSACDDLLVGGVIFFPAFMKVFFFGLLVCLMKLFCLVCSAFKALTVIAWHDLALCTEVHWRGTSRCRPDYICHTCFNKLEFCSKGSSLGKRHLPGFGEWCHLFVAMFLEGRP